MAQVDDERNQGVAEQRMLACGLNTTRSATDQIKIRVKIEARLARQSEEAQVQTGCSRLSAA